jgi:hypothetical protein
MNDMPVTPSELADQLGRMADRVETTDAPAAARLRAAAMVIASRTWPTGTITATPRYSAPILYVGGPLDGGVSSGPVYELPDDFDEADAWQGVPIPGTHPPKFYPGEYVAVPLHKYARIFQWVPSNTGADQ